VLHVPSLIALGLVSSITEPSRRELFAVSTRRVDKGNSSSTPEATGTRRAQTKGGPVEP